MKQWTASAIGACLGLCPLPALAHPHVFTEARMEIVGAPDGTLHSVRNIWRMDELFSSSVLFDFDADASGDLDEAELAAVGEVVRQSIAEWGYYTFVEIAGHEVAMKPPEKIRTLWQNGQLVMFFEMVAGEAVDLAQKPVTFSVFDDSFFVAFDFAENGGFQLFDLPASCSMSVDEPDPDAAAEEWMNSISMLDPNQSVPDDGIVWGSVLSTKARVSCG